MAYVTKKQSDITRQINVLDAKGGLTPFTYNSMEWPIGSLGSVKYPHYAIFYINETLKSEQAGLVQNNFIMGTKTTGSSMSVVATNAGAKTAINAITNGSIGALNSGINVANKITAGSNAAGVTKVSPLSNIPNVEWTSTKKRLKQCICLPMPQKVRANYSAAYTTTEEVGAFGAVIAAALNPNSSDTAMTMAMAAAPTAVGMVSKVTRAAVSNVPVVGSAVSTAIANASPSGKQVSQILSKISGRVINKRQEQLFDNMEFRTHQFSYLFIPRSKDESDSITNIIKEFKIHMHPELNAGQGSSLLITPAEFDIEFRFLNDENLVISKIATCALKSCEVNYTAIGEFVAFKDTPNPIAISLDLTFMEMEPLTREMIRQGF